LNITWPCLCLAMSATGVTVSAGYERPPEQAEPAHCQRTFGILGLVTLGIVLGAVGMRFVDSLPVSPVWGRDVVASSEGVSLESGGRSDSGVPMCGAEGSFDWQVLSAADVLSKDAISKGLSLLEAERAGCVGGGLPAFPFEASDFEHGMNHSHFVHVQHKFASTCNGQTFKLHYFLGGGDYSFALEVHHSLAAKTWQILRSRPPACDIEEGIPAGPEILPPSGKLAQSSAHFVLSELAYRMETQKCLGRQEGLKLGSVKQIKTSIDAGLLTELILEVEHVFPDGKSDEKVVQASILQVCDAVRGTCLDELVLPKDIGSVCDMLQKPSDLPVRRLYARIGKLGHIEPDATELMVARSGQSSPRQLKSQQPRSAIMLRHIKSDSAIPEEWHPQDECAQLPILDQGMCGSCYAHAFAAMIGERKCRLDKKSRRLSSESCKDSSKWTDYRSWGCEAYAKHDPGCKSLPDYGQRTHCKKSCGTCPSLERFERDENQWVDAEFEYLPSVAELAPCSESHDGEMSGCSGGNVATIWNYWLRHKPSLKLWRMGAKCKPYIFKCWESKGGVVNPMNMGHCGWYDDYQLFQKPCSCIPHSKRPTEMKCQDSQPPSKCAASTPFAVFSIMNKADGLSTADTVKNMQRHIMEHGPIYASFATTSAFMDWDWKEKPVYTGGGSNVGGHAIVLTGWGTEPKQKADFWRFKNSWGPEYADGGYGKFQRGVNLDQIEEREMTAAMLDENFADFSAPQCNLHQWSTAYWKAGDQLTQYKIYYHVKCNKDAKVKVFASHRIQKRSDIYKGVTGNEETVDAKSNVMAKVPFDLVHAKFGLEAGDQWIKIQATDDSGNKHDNTHFVSIPTVPGVQSYGS